jgi:hypothetical protein
MTDQRDILDRLRDPDYRGAIQHLRSWVEMDRLCDDAISEITAHRVEIEKLQENLEAMHDAAFAATVVADPPKPERWETWFEACSADSRSSDWTAQPFGMALMDNGRVLVGFCHRVTP